ncbi:MAG TPA: hypothetical protein PLC40_10175, partial [Candidatus Hydrogenedentes bacterium]|nr:hypothetical protein [Candidatus Hydrogenedentota bacterium]
VLLQKPESPVSALKFHDLMSNMQTPHETMLVEWQAIVAQHPEAAVPLYFLSTTLNAIGSTGEAKEVMRRAQEINPTISDVIASARE